MAKKKIMCSMIEVEKEYYPSTFNERRNKIKKKTSNEVGTYMAQIALKEIEGELKKLETIS